MGERVVGDVCLVALNAFVFIEECHSAGGTVGVGHSGAMDGHSAVGDRQGSGMWKSRLGFEFCMHMLEFGSCTQRPDQDAL